MKMTYLFYLPVLLHIGYTQPTHNRTECNGLYIDPESKTRTFHSLVEYQGSKTTFNMNGLGYQGNIVNFDCNTIERLPKNSFVSFDSEYITKISLDHKGLRTIDIGAFLGLICLYELDLSFNNLSHLTEGSFEGLENLGILDLSHNLLENIPDSGLTFFTLKNLRELDLSHNRISSLEKYSFMTSSELEELRIGFNKIRTIPDGLFNYMRRLRVLELDNNYLTDITPENWKGLFSLSVLNLAGNYLTSFDTTHNFSFLLLESLNLSGNSLTKLNVFGIRQHLPSLKMLDLNRNNWFCEDLEIIKHQLQDSSIAFEVTVNCSEVTTTSVKHPSPESTPTPTTPPTPVTSKARDYAKEVYLQNGEVLVSNKRLEDSVDHLQKLLVYLNCYGRCFMLTNREGYVDPQYAEHVVLSRR
ncbi:hypothetical protein JTB14_019561 [Gonioctena quinquepunctata]|nr:hypothetical protein JTB14_019561 [Gonioctena quinquepunctata]